MGLGDFFISSVKGVDEQWVAKLRHITTLIFDLKKRGIEVTYKADKKMNLLIDYVGEGRYYFEYSEIDDAVDLVTDIYNGANIIQLHDKYGEFSFMNRLDMIL